MTEENLMKTYDKIRERAASGNTPATWRSVEELEDSPEFQDALKREFPSQEEKWVDPVSRRSFLQLMGASLALSGLAGCTGFTKPREHIFPYTNQPEQMVLGKALFFATAMPFMGYGYPILAESHEGRPTKIEGNPDHPDSMGSALGFVQASVLDLYDPDRAQLVTYLQEARDWGDLTVDLGNQLGSLQDGGAGLALLTGTVTSPTTADMISRLQEQYPNMRWVQWDPTGRDNIREGARLAFGEYVDTHYNFDNADVVLTLDSDFMVEGPAAVRNSKAFARRRRVQGNGDNLNRFYAVESTPTSTGTLADHKLLLKPSLVEAFARALAAELGVSAANSNPNPALAAHQDFLAAVVADLSAANGRAVVVAGADASPAVHALAHAINGALGSVGNVVTYSEPVEARPTNQLAELTDLTAALNAGQVNVLVVLDSNPVYSAPGDLNFGEAILKAPWRMCLSSHLDETAELCQWHVPKSHYLETWGDIRSSDGTVSIIQPLIAPLFNSRSEYDVIQTLLGESGKTAFNLIQDYWQARTAGNFEKAWRRAVHDGFIADTAAPVREVTASTEAAAFPQTPAAEGIEVAIRPDPSVQDGRFANNAWLQELPKPFTKLTWDNAVHMSLATAQKLGVTNEDVVTVEVNGRTIEGPVFITMGHAQDCITLHLGYGRRKSGRVAMQEESSIFTARGNMVGMPRTVGSLPRGMDVYQVWKSDQPRLGVAAKVTKVAGKTYPLACTQLHFSLDDNGFNPSENIPVFGKMFQPIADGPNVQPNARGIVRRGTVKDMQNFLAAEQEKQAAGDGEKAHKPHSYAENLWKGHLWEEEVDFYEGAWDYSKGYGWGMTVDQSVCNGCNACVIACQAENNIPIVGKLDVRKQREMHWMRIDQYYSGDIDNPTITNQPMMCQHCETAPCEVVCPVAATTHSPEGINEMTYNRCVGTRFCSNNCPYKVRRFNWFAYTRHVFASPLAKMVQNPDVTVRSRGVIEKCTFCVQRVNNARIEAENEGRPIRDGEIVVACEATCPTDAIVFGNVNDPNSRVSRIKAGTLNYGVLTDLNTKPRTTYLAVIKNPNPEIEEA